MRHFVDYREMLATLGDTLDAVIVDTPDHMHAAIAVAAMQAGKHVYCQKPLSHTLWEARQMRLWAEKSSTVTQMGNQIHSSAEYRTATRLLRELTIGKVREVYSWAGVTGNERTRLFTAPAPAPVPVPEGLDWDLWIGAAPMRDDAPAHHPFTWRDWQDFGGGALGDFGCHILDLARMAAWCCRTSACRGSIRSRNKAPRRSRRSRSPRRRPGTTGTTGSMPTSPAPRPPTASTTPARLPRRCTSAISPRCSPALCVIR